MLLRSALVALMACLTVAFTGEGFAGCGGGSPPGGPLPVAEETACFADDECIPTGCEDIRCRAGQCVVVAALRDADEDGEAPPPCGGDCDDADARVFPGASESCNARDDDCDARVDEMAPPGAITTTLSTADVRIAAAPLEDRIVLTDSGFAAGLRLRTADFEGGISLPTIVTPELPLLSEVSATADGGVLVIARMQAPDAFVLEAFPLSLTPSGALFVETPTWSTTTGAEPTAITVEPFGDTFVVVWDDALGVRSMMLPRWSAPVVVLDGSTGFAPLDVATDGTSLIVPTATDAVTYFDATGVAGAVVTLPGTLADQPIASSASDVLVGYRDTFDHLLARMADGVPGASHTAPSVGAGFPLRIDETPLGVLVTRFDTIEDPDVGVSAQLLRPTLDLVVATFPARDVSAGRSGRPTNFDVVASEAGTAVLTNFGDSGSVLTVLGCQPL